MTAGNMHEQCPFVTPNGDPPRVLHCGLKEGHENVGYGHVDTYEAHAGTVESWHQEWFRLPEDELIRLRSVCSQANF
jgi:hypothetical protein